MVYFCYRTVRKPVTLKIAIKAKNNTKYKLTNSFIWVTKGGDLSTADWGCLAGGCVSLCLQAARGGRAAGGSG